MVVATLVVVSFRACSFQSMSCAFVFIVCLFVCLFVHVLVYLSMRSRAHNCVGLFVSSLHFVRAVFAWL